MISQDPYLLPNVSVTICTPKYQLYPAVTAIIDSKNNAILDVLLPNDTIPDPPLEVDPLFNGSTFNGYALDWFNPAVSTPDNPNIEGDRKTAIRTGLLTAIVFQGESYLDNNVNPYVDDGYFNITNMVYSNYLSHVAHEVYFKLPSTDLASIGGVPKNVTIHTEELRLYVNSVSAYGSSGLLVLLALGVLVASQQLYGMRDIQIPELKEPFAPMPWLLVRFYPESVTPILHSALTTDHTIGVPMVSLVPRTNSLTILRSPVSFLGLVPESVLACVLCKIVFLGSGLLRPAVAN
jgi:hypothetical protein